MNSQTWDNPAKILQPEDIDFPEETYGMCQKPRCFNEGELGNGICQECWDKGSDGKPRIRTRVNKKKLDVPIIIINNTDIIIS